MVGQDLLVTEVRPDGSQHPLHHRIFLAAVYGDSPGIRALVRWLSHNGFRGCWNCLLKGLQEGGTTCFPGYCDCVDVGCPEALRQHPLFKDVPEKARCRDSSIFQTSEMLRVIVAKFEELKAAEQRVTYRQALRKEYGTHGRSLVDVYLGHYVDLLNVFPGPSLLHGGPQHCHVSGRSVLPHRSNILLHVSNCGSPMISG